MSEFAKSSKETSPKNGQYGLNSLRIYIHDQGLQQTLRIITCGVNMYEPTYMKKQLYFTYSVTFFWLKLITFHQLTQYLCYNIPFHICEHWSLAIYCNGKPELFYSSFCMPV